MVKKINVRFEVALRKDLEKDWHPLRTFSRKKRIGLVGDWFEAFGKKYVLTKLSHYTHARSCPIVYTFAMPIEIEEAKIRSKILDEIAGQAFKSLPSDGPLIGVTDPSQAVYSEIRNTISYDATLSFEENYRKAMKIAYNYSPSEWYNTSMFANLVFEARRGNKTAAKYCGLDN